MTFAVLFDLEDTLVKTPWSDHQHVLEFRRETRAKLIELGTPPRILKGIERSTLMRNKAFEYIQEHPKEIDVEKFNREMGKFLAKYELDSAEKSKIFPDTITTLEKFKELEIKTGLVTNTSSKAVEVMFQLHGLKKYFNVTITREKVKKLKPDPEGLQQAIKKLGVKNFFMIGDLDLDASAAKSANGIAIIVRRNPKEKINFKADYIVQSLNEIPLIVQKEMKRNQNLA